MPANEKISTAANKPADSKSKAKAKAPKSPNQKATSKASRKTKSWVLIKPIDAVIARDDETVATFFAEDVGLTFDDNDRAVARAVEMYPDHFA